MVGETDWIAFRPWPAAVLAEVEVTTGLRASVPDLHQEFALNCQLSDPCWEGSTARVLALQALAAQEPDQALAWIDEAGRRGCRETDGLRRHEGGSAGGESAGPARARRTHAHG